MADLSRYLRRFRRLVAPPGRPAVAAVPADRARAARDELADVLAAIDEVEGAAQRVRAQGHRDADTRRQQGHEHAADVLAESRATADQVRADAAATRRGELDDEIAQVEATATAEVDRIRQATDRHLDALADRLVRHVLTTGTPAVE